MNGRLAFLSTEDLSGFYTYEQLTFPHFEALGWSVESVPWRATVDWSGFELVVIRTPWDYQSDAAAFMHVLADIDRATRLENSLSLCRWNLEKTYLRQLETAGVSIVPTRWYDAGTAFDERVFEVLGADEVVIKPVVSANADHTYRVGRRTLEEHAAVVERDFSERDYMVQPFMRGIADEGEHSLFYFDGTYSHAVLKSPRSGDFRVQEEHGGEISSIRADERLRAAGAAAMAALAETPLYARADFVLNGDRPLLMELELIEPSLYFPYDDDAPRRFAEACIRRVAPTPGSASGT